MEESSTRRENVNIFDLQLTAKDVVQMDEEKSSG